MRGDLAAGMGKTPHRNLGLSVGAFIVRWRTFLQWTSPVLPPLRMSPDACFSIAATKSGSIPTTDSSLLLHLEEKLAIG